jgi:hypothetical protein
MLTDLMQDQREKLVKQIQDQSSYVDPTAVAAIALIDILDVLLEMRKPFSEEE